MSLFKIHFFICYEPFFNQGTFVIRIKKTCKQLKLFTWFFLLCPLITCSEIRRICCKLGLILRSSLCMKIGHDFDSEGMWQYRKVTGQNCTCFLPMYSKLAELSLTSDKCFPQMECVNSECSFICQRSDNVTSWCLDHAPIIMTMKAIEFALNDHFDVGGEDSKACSNWHGHNRITRNTSMVNSL